MKKFALACFFVLAFVLSVVLVLIFPSLPAFGQQVDSSQVKVKTNGGLTGDTANALAVGVYRSGSAPSSPVTGQLWCDTNYSPCILKMYTGSAWSAPPAAPTIPTQVDSASFPGSPVDGQIFFTSSPPALWIYSSTLSKWVSWPTSFITNSPSIRDVYSSSVIAAPGAPTVAASATAGSLSAGTYSYKVTCRNSSGGETTGGTLSADVSPGASKSTDLSSIPTCPTGGVARGIYRSKANGNVSGPWYWVATISDNSTTTLNDGLADASQGVIVPDINFSGALPGNWFTQNDTSSTTTGGCGTTSRNTMACMSSNAGVTSACAGSPTTDSWLKAMLDISSYTSGDLTIEYRLVQSSVNGDTFTGPKDPVWGGLRNGTATGAIRTQLTVGSGNAAPCGPASDVVDFYPPPTTSNRPRFGFSDRRSVNGTPTMIFYVNNPMPQVQQFPLWIRYVKRGGYWVVYISQNGLDFTRSPSCTGSNNYDSACGLNSAFGANSTYVEIPLGQSSVNATLGQYWIEIDNFSLTVN